MVNLSRLEEIKDLRTVWPHEALDFTPWLSQDDNISLLADAIGLDIAVDETESSVGDFNVDIFASETGTDRKIIIENQLEDTNHDHLGKLITYASGKSADVIVWVVKHAREEHKAAIEWLNNHTDEKIGFFLCEIKLYRIGTSEPAVKFEVIEKPNDWTKEVKKSESANVLLPATSSYLKFKNGTNWMWNCISARIKTCSTPSLIIRMSSNPMPVCPLTGEKCRSARQVALLSKRTYPSETRANGMYSLTG